MKRTLQICGVLLLMLLGSNMQAQRYAAEVYPQVTVTPDTAYGRSYEYFPNPPFATAAAALKKMKMDIYQPVGDTATLRPLVVYLETGSFLPKYFNGGPTGDRKDSASVEMCKKFAKRGYTSASVSYRKGWNPLAPTADARKKSIIQAVYRALQDVKGCVRYFKYSAEQLGNPWKVDTNRIVICGQGTGGYIAMAYVSLNDPAQIIIPKFIDFSDPNNPVPMVVQSALGDYDGFKTSDALPMADTLVYENYAGYGSDVQMAVNMGGALGDISWLTAGTAPIAAFHSATDPFAPDTNGIVTVPGTGPPAFEVVPVSGSRDVVRKQVQLGNHAQWVGAGFNDVYTQQANLHNEGWEGYYRFLVAPLQNPQAGPWDWWDSTTTVLVCQQINALTGANLNGTNIHLAGKATNPNMSKAKAVAYIDTIQGYLAPRIMCTLQLPGSVCLPDGIEENAFSKGVSVFPNPSADGDFTLNITNESFATAKGVTYRLFDATGRLVDSGNVTSNQQQLSVNKSSGIYMLNLVNGNGTMLYAGKLIVK